MRELGILFKADMRRAINDGRKTQTRRMSGLDEINQEPDVWSFTGWIGDRLAVQFDAPKVFAQIKPRYQEDDSLYVKTNYFTKKADAALWLRVTEVKDPHRIQDISEEDALAEGVEYLFDEQTCKTLAGIEGTKPKDHGYKNYLYHGLVGKSITQKQADNWTWQYSNYSTAKLSFSSLWDSINAKPKGVYKTIDGKKVITHYVSYPWDDIQETRQRRGKPWIVCGNPFVFPYVFERVER